MRAHFQITGNSHVDKERLNKSASGYIRICEVNLRYLFSIPSNPSPLFNSNSIQKSFIVYPHRGRKLSLDKRLNKQYTTINTQLTTIQYNRQPHNLR